MSRRPLLAVAAAFCAVALTSDCAAVQEPEEKPAKEEEGEDEDPHADHVITEHTVTIGGVSIDYEARAGTITLEEEDGTEKANVFFVAYTRAGVDDPAERPIMFCFNGGPGSSSVWLHLGTIGPRRVKMTDEGFAPPPPYQLVDNDQSWLDACDLVFIDPVTTGYSRPADGEDPSQFHGVDEDVEWVAEFIRLYTTRFERWASPKFLAGESYGTTRAAGLAGELQGRHGMYLNGIVLVSSILNFQTARFDVGNDLPYVLFLPTYTATAWYHRQLDDELQADLTATLNEVRKFALEEYGPMLSMGDSLPAEQRARLAAKVARYTGLSVEYVEQTNLRIQISRFVKELLRDERRTVGRLDSRFKGIDADAAGDSYEYDASYAAIQGPYTATLNHYVRVELGYENDLPYEILSGRVRPWSYGRRRENRYLNVAGTLRSAMTKNPHLKVYVACGYYDLATPFFASEYTFANLGLDPSLRGNVSFGHFESGHMMYIHLPSLKGLKDDVATFVDGAVPD
jgi:carboxypeptidase C (cathepsin A)